MSNIWTALMLGGYVLFCTCFVMLMMWKMKADTTADEANRIWKKWQRERGIPEESILDLNIVYQKIDYVQFRSPKSLQ